MYLSIYILFLIVFLTVYTDVSLTWRYCNILCKLLFGSEYPRSKEFTYITESQQNSKLIVSFALKFLYHEGVLFSALKMR